MNKTYIISEKNSTAPRIKSFDVISKIAWLKRIWMFRSKAADKAVTANAEYKISMTENLKNSTERIVTRQNVNRMVKATINGAVHDVKSVRDDSANISNIKITKASLNRVIRMMFPPKIDTTGERARVELSIYNINI